MKSFIQHVKLETAWHTHLSWQVLQGELLSKKKPRGLQYEMMEA